MLCLPTQQPKPLAPLPTCAPLQVMSALHVAPPASLLTVQLFAGMPATEWAAAVSGLHQTICDVATTAASCEMAILCFSFYLLSRHRLQPATLHSHAAMSCGPSACFLLRCAAMLPLRSLEG